MTTGRKPKPRALRELQGNPGHRPLPEEPEAAGDIGNPPDWMSDREKWLWRDAVRRAPLGVLTSADRGVLAVWVVAATLHRDARMKVQKEGAVIDGEKGSYQNPHLAIVNRQALIMIKAGAELGFTPCSRPRAGAALKRTKRERSAAFLFGRGRPSGQEEGVN